MRNTCPKCGTAYAVNAAAVGRKFTCKCGTPVVVAPDGLTYQDEPAVAPAPAPAPPPAPAQESTGAAFDFDEPAEPTPAPPKPARAAKSPPKAVEEEDDFEPMPSRPARKRASGGGDLGEYLAFRKFIVPVLIKLIFWFFAIGIALAGLGGAIFLAVSGSTLGLVGAVLIVLIGVPSYVLMVRIYCELILLGFNIHDRLSEIKTLLEKRGP